LIADPHLPVVRWSGHGAEPVLKLIAPHWNSQIIEALVTGHIN
jgi:hypothetical protein